MPCPMGVCVGAEPRQELLRGDTVVARKQPVQGTDGTYAAGFPIRRAGTYRARAAFDDSDHEPGSGSSARRTTPLPYLHSGSSSIYVLLLERRLQQLHDHDDCLEVADRHRQGRQAGTPARAATVARRFVANRSTAPTSTAHDVSAATATSATDTSPQSKSGEGSQDCQSPHNTGNGPGASVSARPIQTSPT